MSRRQQLPEGFKEVDFQFAARHAQGNRECIRLLGLSFLQQGLSVSEAAALLTVTSDSIHDWLHPFKEGGFPAMKDQEERGRKPVIPEASHAAFKDAVLNMQEEKVGGRIVGRDVLKMLKSDFQKECDPRTVYKLLHRVKLSWISGRSKHPKQDLEEQYCGQFSSTPAHIIPIASSNSDSKP